MDNIFYIGFNGVCTIDAKTEEEAKEKLKNFLFEQTRDIYDVGFNIDYIEKNEIF